ncbi:unnamed protein product, partial [Dibothriocephalus latus]
MEYTVEVAAANDEAVGPTVSGKVKTWPGVPEMPEIYYIGYSSSSTQIDVRCREPRLNGELDSYEFVFYLNGEKVDVAKKVPNGNFSSGPLKKPGAYFVEVWANTKPAADGNGGGRGPSNKVGPIMYPPVRSDIGLDITDVSEGVIHLKFFFYMVELPCNIRSNTILYYDDKRNYTEVLTPARNETYLSNLVPGLKYHFRVSADCVDRPAAFTKEV